MNTFATRLFQTRVGQNKKLGDVPSFFILVARIGFVSGDSRRPTHAIKAPGRAYDLRKTNLHSRGG